MSTRAKAYNSAPGAGFARPGQRQNAPRVSSPSITPAQASSPRRSNDLADDSARRLQNCRNVKRKDDDELLELGERLASVQPKLISMLRWVDEVRDLVAMEVRRRGSWPEDTAEWTWRDAAAYCAARECVERETEIGAAYIRAMDALEACYARVDPICNAILSFKASTREGRAVRKMARAIRMGQWPG
jgi:hypothetical protein